MSRGFQGWRIRWYQNFFNWSTFEPYRPLMKIGGLAILKHVSFAVLTKHIFESLEIKIFTRLLLHHGFYLVGNSSWKKSEVWKFYVGNFGMILKIIKLESSTEVEKFSIELQRIIEVGKRSWKSKLERTRN